MSGETQVKIKEMISSNRIVVFMKGTPDFPQCGFSAATVQCFQTLGTTFTAVNVLEQPDIRDGIKAYSGWPTIPQVYINGEFVGGCDIVRDLHGSGELEKKVRAAEAQP